MAVIKEVQILEVRLEVEGMKRQGQEAAGVLQNLQKEKRKLKKANQEGSVEWQKNAEAIRRVSVTMRETNRIMDLSKKAQAAQKGSLNQLRAQLSLMTIKWNSMSQAQRENTKQGGLLQKQIRATSDKLKQQEKVIGDSRRSVGDYGLALGGLRNRLKAVGGQLKTMVLAGGGLFLLVGLFRSAFGVTRDFSKAQSNLAAVLGTTKDEMDALTTSALMYGSTTVFTASQVVSLQTELAKLGFIEKEVLDSTGAILDLAAATNSDLATAAKVAGSALRAFNLDASEMERVASVLAVSTTKTALSFGDFEAGLSNVAPVAAAFGFSIEETVALFGKLRDAGFDASKATTATRNIILNLADAGGDLAMSLGGAVKTFPEMIQGLITLRDRGIDLSQSLELTDKRSVGAFNTFLQGAESAQDLAENLVDVNDELSIMVATQLDNLAGDVTLLNSAWEGFILNLEKGDGILSALARGTVALITGTLEAFTSLERETSLGDLLVERKELNATLKETEERLVTLKDGNFFERFALKARHPEASIGIYTAQVERYRVKLASLSEEIKAEDDAIQAAAVAAVLAGRVEPEGGDFETEAEKRERIRKEKKAQKDLERAEKKAKREAEQEKRFSDAKAKKIKEVERTLRLSRLDEDEADLQRIRDRFEKIIIIIQESSINEQEAERLKGEALIAQAQELGDKKLENDLAAKEIIAKEEEKQFKLKQQRERQILTSAIQTANTLKNLAKEGTAAYKALAITETLINTYASATAAYKALAGIPVAGPVLGAAAAAAATVAGLANVAQIAKAKRGGVMKAKRGAAIGKGAGWKMYEAGGNLHSAGGTMYRGDDGNHIEVERDEILTVLNRNSSAMIKRLSDFNVAGGGVSFMKRGGVPVFQDGGVAAASISSPVQAKVTASQDIREIIESLPAQFISVAEFEAVQSRINIVEAKATTT